MNRGLADTSIFIASESGRTLGELPDHIAISVVTIGELELGVLATTDDDTRARRADTLALARESDPIPIDEAIMSQWARLVIDCRRAGITKTVKLTDSLIAATAACRGLPVATQDDDYSAMARAHRDLKVIRV